MSALRVPTLNQTARSLSGLLATLSGNRDGLKLIDSSLEGVLRSFLVFAWCWPAQAFLWTGVWRDLPESRPDSVEGFVVFFLQAGIFDFIGWLLPALLLIPLSRPFGFRGQLFKLIAMTNWFGLIATYMAFLPATLDLLPPIPDQVTAVMSLVVYVFTIVFYFRLARAVLSDDGLLAAMVTVLLVVTSIVTSVIAFGAMGL